jgi:DnaJ-class molecular chaperone
MLNPCEQFGLAADAAPEQVRVHYKNLARTTHPDAGGSVDEFQAMVARYRKALEYAEQPRTCPRCEGEKQVYTMAGFTATWMTCPVCNGEGKIKMLGVL